MGCIARILRLILSLIAGYTVLATIVVGGLFGVAFAMGAAFCYDGDSWLASTPFCAISLVIGFIAALAGGAVSALIARRAGVWALLTVVGLLGIGQAMSATMSIDQSRLADRPATRPADLAVPDMARWSEKPLWCEWANVVVGLVGIVTGARMARRSPSQRG